MTVYYDIRTPPPKDWHPTQYKDTFCVRCGNVFYSEKPSTMCAKCKKWCSDLAEKRRANEIPGRKSPLGHPDALCLRP